MTHTRLWLAAVFIALTTAALLVPRGGAQSSALKEIVPGVWFREGNLKELGYCNNVIIEMKDYLVVVDANFPGGARLVLADAKAVSPKPVKYVFDTHHHGDHVYGNPVWTKMGAITIAHANVVEEMKRYEPKRWLETVKSRKDVAELHLSAPEPPRRTFDKSPYVIEDSRRRIELHFFGWAHTRGDGFAYLPKEKVLCTGDAVVNGPYNYTGDGSVLNWPNVLRAAQKLDVVHVLPGHGGPAGKELLAGQAKFFVELRNAVESAIKQGKTMDDLVTMRDGNPAATTVRLPESVKTWVGDSLPAQVHDTFVELTRNSSRR